MQLPVAVCVRKSVFVMGICVFQTRRENSFPTFFFNFTRGGALKRL